MAIIDVITYNGEEELFEIRYNILKDYVDEFIVVEFDMTFSGKPKDPSFPFKDWDKVKYFFVKEEYLLNLHLFDEARKSPNTEYGKGAFHWVREWAQKEYLKCVLEYHKLNDEDIVFIGDCDEIYTKEAITLTSLSKLKLRVYTYYLNNRSSESFAGTLVGKWADIKDGCFNHLRSNTKWTNDYYGWHFTSLKDALRKKLTDSYTEDSYASPEVMSRLESNVENNRDFLGRAFTYTIDESDLPQYLKDNKEKWKKLFR